jgi:hypothetical protein
MKENKLIIFGPWVGEFSYEFCWWVPQIREIKNKLYPNYYSLAVSFEGRKGFYKDFVDGFIPLPDSLTKTLKFPSCAAEFVNGQHLIPPIFYDLVTQIKKGYENEFDEIIIHSPIQEEFSLEKIYNNNPKGERIHYTPDINIENKIKNLINNYFPNDKDIVTIMARNRNRFQNLDQQTLSSEKWGEVIKSIIDNINVNVILLGIESKHSKGGSYFLKNLNIPLEYQKNILTIPLNGEDSSEKQFSILKNTKCSFYGGSGAGHLPFFMNTPVFIHQTKENGFRLKFDWQKKLTNNHKNVKIFDKYPKYQFQDTPTQELINEFIEFYKKI